MSLMGVPLVLPILKYNVALSEDITVVPYVDFDNVQVVVVEELV